MIQEINGKHYHDGVEISASEYAELLNEIEEKAALVNDISTGAKTINDCPEEWRNEIAHRVADRESEGEPEPTLDEIVDILLGGAS